MTKNLFYLTFVFVAFVTFCNGASKCTESEDGFMYCEDMSSQGQAFLNRRNDEKNIPVLQKRKVSSNVCLNSRNDPIYGILSGFDIFCFDEISVAQSFNITGRIAAKNSINIGQVTINGSYDKDCSKHDFKYAIYTDKLTMGDGNVHGGIHYGSSLGIKDYLEKDLKENNCAISNDPEDNLDFESIEKRVNELSTQLGQVVSNAKIEVHDSPNRRLLLTKDITDYVIDVDENTFSSDGGYEFSIENPDGLNPNELTIIFNVKGESFTLSNAGFVMGELGSKIIWNMPEVTEANFNSANIYGLLLAPKAHVNLVNGKLFGKVVSKNITTGIVSIKEASFNGCVPNPDVRYDDETVCNDENVESKVINSDIVFVFDESISMCTYIDALRKKLQDLIDDLEEAKANARFAVVGFGGKPRIYTSFTSNINEVNAAFNNLNCKQGGQESGLEAIRMFLNKSSKFLNKDNQEFTYDIEGLSWRDDSTKTIILVTDEDSDLPHYSENRNDLQKANAARNLNVSNYSKITEENVNEFVGFPYYGNSRSMPAYEDSVYFEPAFSPAILTTANEKHNFYRSGTPLVLSEAYQKEVDETAKLIINENIQLYMLLNDDLAQAQGSDVSNSQFDSKNPYWKKLSISESDDSSTITAQYGNPLIDSVDKEYERESVLSLLVEKKQEKSLQGQILNSKGFCRAFNMKDFVNQNSGKMVQQFYKTIVTSVQKCNVVKVPKEVIEEEEETTTTADVTTTTEATPEVTTIADPNIEWPTGPYRNVTICDDGKEVKSREINSDIVFIIDESSSMCKYIDAMRNKLNNFITALGDAEANARFAIIGFGGEPRIYSPFTNDITSVEEAFAKLNCQQGGQESGLEAIRMFLKRSKKFINKIEDPYSDEKFTDVNQLKWRSGSTKTIILVTDEDSDLPIYKENMNDLQIENLNNNVDVEAFDGKVISKTDAANFIGFPYYLNKANMPEYSSKVFFEPAFSPAILTRVKNTYTFYRSASPIVLSPSFQKEVDETAELITKENIQLFMLLNDDLADSQGSDVANSQFDEKNPYWLQKGFTESDDASTITAQYGNPNLDSLKKTEFDRIEIYNELAKNKQNKSLQGRILSNKGFCRAFNMKDFINNESEKMVELFYETVVRTVKHCRVVPEPIEETTTTTEEIPTVEETTVTSTQEPTSTPEIEWPTGPYRNVTICEDEDVESKEIDADIVFIIDESASMCKYIDPMRKKLNKFMEALKKAKANSRFAIIGFGGKPRIYSAFTEDVDAVEKAFDKLNCEESGQESGLEAIRMFLNKSDKFINKIESVFGEESFSEIDNIEWRSDSQKTIILVTDEDSDLPQYEENRNDLQIANLKNIVDVKEFSGKEVSESDIQSMIGYPYYLNKGFMPKYSDAVYFEPSFSPAKLTSVNGVYTFYRSASPLVLSASYQKEVDETAKLINSKNVQLFMLLNTDLADSQGADVANSQFNEKNPYWKKLSISESDDSSTITAQYGNPLLDSFTDTEFQREKIYNELVSKNQEKSLQGQILASQGFCRAFNMKEFTTGRSEKMVELFYKTVVRTVKNCKIVPVPIEETTTTEIETSTSTILETITEVTTSIETSTSTVEEISESTNIPEDTTTSIESTTSTETETETETETPTETPIPGGTSYIPIIVGGTIGAAALAAAGAAIFKSTARKAGNQLANNVFEDNVGMENPLYEGTSGQNENPLYEANVNFDSLEDNIDLDAFA
jgi:choice-of-anchor A domain-containing protein